MTKENDQTDDLALDRQVCFPIYAASNLVTRLYKPVLGPLGLTYPQYLVMLVLWENAPQTIGSLGKRLHLDSGTLTPLVKRLAVNGLVTRTRDTVDERRVLVSLTEKGQALRETAEAIPGRLLEDLPISVEELETLRDTVQHFVRVMNADADTGPHDRGPRGKIERSG